MWFLLNAQWTAQRVAFDQNNDDPTPGPAQEKVYMLNNTWYIQDTYNSIDQYNIHKEQPQREFKFSFYKFFS